MCSLFDFIRRRFDYKSGFLCRLTSWKWELHVFLMGRDSVTISYSSRCLTIETEKYINENSFIENVAASKYSMWHREANKNVIINNNYKCFLSRRRAALSCENVNRFVSVNYSVQRKRSNGTWCFFFSFSNRHEQVFCKAYMICEKYTSCSKLTMVSLIKNIYCIKHPYLSMPVLIRVLKIKSLNLS